MTEFNVWAAVRTLKGRLGSNVGFQIAQRLNAFITQEDWDIALHEARQILAHKRDELSKPLNRRPMANEILPFKVSTPGGWIQQVEVYVRDRDTGLVDTRHFSIRTDTLRARMTIVKDAWNQFQKSIDEKPEDYPEEVVGVAYVGTYNLIAKKK